MKTRVDEARILVLGVGSTQAARNNSKGHLFERFIANWLADEGFEQPSTRRLNVTSRGVEIDVRSTHTVTRKTVLAECKAYSLPLAVEDLMAFYGKLSSERLTEPDLLGFFVAIPGLTSNADEQRRWLEQKDVNFRVFIAEELLDLLTQKSHCKRIRQFDTRTLGPISDEALLISEHGLFLAGREADATTRLARRVVVFSLDEQRPAGLLEAVGQAEEYADLPCEYFEARPGYTEPSAAPEPEPAIVEVVFASSDFEYQLPAAPEFFVGRKELLLETRALIRSVEEGRAKVVVFNAQSGSGKSSLALRLAYDMTNEGCLALCIDCRTAAAPSFVAASIRRMLLAATTRRLCELPSDASFASLSETIKTLQRTQLFRPAGVFFDQFESVLRDKRLTREFRDLCLAVAELDVPLVLGFAWKTDVIALTEGYPYQFRDDIRSVSTVFVLEPFGAEEIGELVRRMQRASGKKLHRDLKNRLREYSQGLPWLFKKLASHILKELASGTSQDELLAEVLNVQALFEKDLDGLSLAEREALRRLARNAPLLASEAGELVGADVVQTLLNQRLIVSIGEKVDIYWDIFKDFLLLGVVPIQDAYILRSTPSMVRRVLKVIHDKGGSTTAEAVAAALNSTEVAVLNLARDLRQIGVLAAVEGRIEFSKEVSEALDRDSAVRWKAATALKRHRVLALLAEVSSGGEVRMDALAQALRRTYPSVVAGEKTWHMYARAFAYWFQVAGLAAVRGDRIIVGEKQPPLVNLFEPRRTRVSRGQVIFPRGQAGPLLLLLERLASGLKPANVARLEGDAILLGLCEKRAGSGLTVTDMGRRLAAAREPERARLVMTLIEGQPAVAIARSMVALDSAVSPEALGKAVAEHFGVEWSKETRRGVGKQLRSWLRMAGLRTRIRRAPAPDPNQPELT